MRRVLCLILVLLAFPHSVFAETNTSAEAVSEVIRKAVPADFGYVDNTEYAMQHDFAELSFVDDSCIVVCAESTNFNEFGVFHTKSEKDARQCERTGVCGPYGKIPRGAPQDAFRGICRAHDGKCARAARSRLSIVQSKVVNIITIPR